MSEDTERDPETTKEDPTPAPLPICGFMVLMAPNAAGVAIQPLTPEAGVQRMPTKMDQIALCRAWEHSLQAQATVNLSCMVEDQRMAVAEAQAMEEQRIAQLAGPRNGHGFSGGFRELVGRGRKR